MGERVWICCGACVEMMGSSRARKYVCGIAICLGWPVVMKVWGWRVMGGMMAVAALLCAAKLE